MLAAALLMSETRSAGVRAPLRNERGGVARAEGLGSADAKAFETADVSQKGPPPPSRFRFIAEGAAGPATPPPPPPKPLPPRGRMSAHAPETFTQMYVWVQLNYCCSGRISDGGAACASHVQNPPRTMNCMCDHENANTLLVPCRCSPR